MSGPRAQISQAPAQVRRAASGHPDGDGRQRALAHSVTPPRRPDKDSAPASYGGEQIRRPKAPGLPWSDFSEPCYRLGWPSGPERVGIAIRSLGNAYAKVFMIPSAWSSTSLNLTKAFCGRHSGGVFEADQAIEPLDLGEPLMAEATLVVVEPVNKYVLRAAVGVICGVHRRRRADLVHERNGE
jgi:hypothetical protein